MEEIIKVVVDNGISVGCFLAFIYFIFVDKKESNLLFESINQTLKSVNDTLVKVQLNLTQLNERVGKLEESKEK